MTARTETARGEPRDALLAAAREGGYVVIRMKNHYSVKDPVSGLTVIALPNCLHVLSYEVFGQPGDLAVDVVLALQPTLEPFAGKKIYPVRRDAAIEAEPALIALLRAGKAARG